MNKDLTQLVLVDTTLPYTFEMHSCSTFDDKIWICAPFNKRRRNARTSCWTFDGFELKKAPSLLNGR